MNENNGNTNNRYLHKNLSIEEKRRYCMAWKKSGMNQVEFSRANGISKSALYKWGKELKKEDKDFGFSPVTLEEKVSIKQSDMVQLTISLPNQMQLSIMIPEGHLVSFVRELGHATAIVR